MQRHHQFRIQALRKPSLLAGAICVALGTTQVQALDFSRGELGVRLDTTLTYSAGMRVADQDDDLIAKSFFNPGVSALPIEQQIASRGAFSANSDDGNLNFDQWDLFQNQFRILSELEINYRNYGLFVRGNFFHDFEVEDNRFISGDARDKSGQRGRLLDAYVYGDFTFADRQLTTRLGRQVLAWGESTFIGGGLNVINPVDVTALRTAGAELREAFLPLNMFWSSLEVTQRLSIEGMLMFEWDRVEPEAAGTFFSTNDFATDGGRFAMLGFGLVPQPVRNSDLFDEVCGMGNFGASDTGLPPQLVGAGCSVALPRAADRNASNGGQYGVAARYFADWLNDTELGLYYLRFHSRVPLISGISVTSSNLTTGRFFVEYPEDIDMFGGSFNTTIPGGWALSGELTYRRNLPLQIDDVEVLFAGLSPLNAVIPEPALRFNSQLGEFGPGQEIRGWERRKVSQIQSTLLKLWGPNNFLKADQITTLGEIGATHVWDLPDRDQLRFEGPGTSTGGGAGNQLNGGDLRNPVTTTDGFATAFSWGYRFVIAPTYNNLIGAWNMTPRLAFNHDVTGTSPGPGGNFIEGRKQVTLGLRFDYQSQWNLDVAYTNFFGAGNRNQLSDRDFVTAALSYSF